MAARSRHQFRIKRVYEELLPEDGKRFLIDRLWPRGISKKALSSVQWLPEVAPSPALRNWFGHDPAKWPEFQKRYRLELKNNASAWAPLLEAIRESDVTLLFGSRNIENNQAVVLKGFLEEKIRSKKNKQKP
ncbi:MAG TPA: DUF488 family protein [Verrucomicrobiae bacterium]|jgi:uncharacterized protein YeaO (DUF488 family)